MSEAIVFRVEDVALRVRVAGDFSALAGLPSQARIRVEKT